MVGLLFPHGNYLSSIFWPMKERAPLDQARSALEAIAFGSVAITTRALTSAGLDLTFAQWRVLVIVGDDPNGATVTEIATRLDAEISPVSRLIGRVARRGLVRTGKDDQDRRVTRVTLTDAGGKLRESVLDHRRRLLAEVIAEAGPIEPDLANALDRIGIAMRHYT
ncbi:MAG: MarR family transcriptional regulator, lower aerobic nicotinate degradation pathway regulator [Chloroflexota bacterium]|jgi:DNA-binding MarR family transcriptional regulator|nr:MarR family transcriptional regulator, lower aerobic nicotinate degradation pathway regulator [Chloroflexota bacterium]